MTVSNKGLLHRLYEMFFSPTIAADTGTVKTRYSTYLDEELLTGLGAAVDVPSLVLPALVVAGARVNVVVMWARGGSVTYMIGGVTTGLNTLGGWLPENGGVKLRVDDDGTGAVLDLFSIRAAAGSFAHIQWFYEA